MAVIPSPVLLGDVSDTGFVFNTSLANTLNLIGDIVDTNLGYGLQFLDPLAGTNSWGVTLTGSSGSLEPDGFGVGFYNFKATVANTLTINAGAAAAGYYAGVSSTTLLNITNNGQIAGEDFGIDYYGFAGVVPGDDSNLDSFGIINTKVVTVSNNAGASILGGFIAVNNWSHAKLTLNNSGDILGGRETFIDGDLDGNDDDWGGAAVSARATLALNNTLTGYINGDVGSAWFGSTITNAGTIDGTIASWFEEDDVFLISDNGTPDDSSDDIIGLDVNHDGDAVVAAGDGVLASTVANTYTNTGTINGTYGRGHYIWDDNLTPGDFTDDIVALFQVSFDLNNAKDTITNSGKIVGEMWLNGGDDKLVNNLTGEIYGHVDLSAGNDTLDNKGLIAGLFDSEGEYHNWINGGNGNNTILNSGVIDGGYNGGDGDDKVTNTGHFFGGLDLGSGNNEVVSNTILIDGDINAGIGNDKLTSNLGTIFGGVYFGDGTNTVINAGTIDGSVYTENGKDTITNTGVIRGEINAGDGDNVVTNSKTLMGDLNTGTAANLTVAGVVQVEKITNSGTIWGSINTGDGNRTVINSGVVENSINTGNGNDTVTNSRDVRFAINLGDGVNVMNNTATGTVGEINAGEGTNTITNDGVVRDNISVGDGNNTIKNTRTVYGSIFAGNDTTSGIVNTITNSGTIFGNLDAGNGDRTIVNSGTVHQGISTGTGLDTINNSGTVNDGIDAGDGNNFITNTKFIYGGVNAGAGNDTLNNTAGTIWNHVNLGDGTNILTNTGTVYNGAEGGADVDTFTNSKFIYGDVYLNGDADKFENKMGASLFGNINVGDGNNTIINAGTLYWGVYGGSNDDTVTNTGRIFDEINLGIGKDSLTISGTAGRADGEIWMGGGDDTVIGGVFAERVYEAYYDGVWFYDNADGKDTYQLGAGNDFIFAASDGASLDIYDGGIGTKDEIDFSSSDSVGGSVINLTIKTIVFAGPETDTVQGFEIVRGTAFDDQIIGDDTLAAGVAETLDGNGGADTINGGLNADKLYAGDDGAGGFDGDSDTFVYESVNDSKVALASRDTIYQFDDAMDIVDLTLLDAVLATLGDQSFEWIGVNQSFSGTGAVGTAGELRAVVRGNQTIIEGDTGGNRAPDFAIALDGIHLGLAASNFLGVVDLI